MWLEDGKVCRRHQDQIRKRADEAYDTWTGDRSSGFLNKWEGMHVCVCGGGGGRDLGIFL